MAKRSVLDPAELQKQTQKAVRTFWKTKKTQGASQGQKTGDKDRGTRAHVTGGRHLDGFLDLFRTIAVECGVPSGCVRTAKNDVVLPGFFRATKQWDLLIVCENKLVAVVELKSQFGSLGNNANNRAEEAVGNAHDFWTAYRNEQMQASPRPWLGYLFLLEDSADSNKVVSVREPHFPVLEAYRTASYMERYTLCCKQMVRERLYDAASLIASDAKGGPKGQYREPDAEVGLDGLVASFYSHLSALVRAKIIK